MNYARALRVLRASKNISQQDLARKVGLSKSLLSKVEADQRELTDSNKQKIATALHVPASLLDTLALDREDEKISKSDLQQIGKALLSISNQIESLDEKTI